jgi:hypothetical protein
MAKAFVQHGTGLRSAVAPDHGLSLSSYMYIVKRYSNVYGGTMVLNSENAESITIATASQHVKMLQMLLL